MLATKVVRSGVTVLLVMLTSLGVIVSSARMSEALGLPDWMTTGTLCDTSTWSGGFKNVAPGALASAGVLSMAPEAGVAAGSVAAATADLTAPIVLGAIMQGCVLPGFERNILAPWVAGTFGGGDSAPAPTTEGEICPGMTFNGSPCRNVGTLIFTQLPVITTQGGSVQGTTINAGATAIQGWISMSDAYDVAIDTWADCVPAAGGSSVSRQGPRLFVSPRSGEPRFQPGNLTCNSGEKMVSVRLNGIRATGPGYYYGYTENVKYVFPTAPVVTSVTASTTCQRPDGTTYTLTNTGTPATGPAGVVEQGIALPLCNAGDTPTKIDAGPTGLPGWSPNLKPTLTDQMKYPACAAAGCVYSIAIDGNTCLIGEPSCANWTLIRKTTPSRVTCFYGPYAVGCDLLNWMERAYETTRKVVTKVNVDGDPDTKTDAPNPPLDPNENPSTPPVIPTQKPPVDGCLNGSPLCTPTLDPKTPPAERNACWPSGFGVFNPANWVLQPIKCGLLWAFVPPAGGEAVLDWWDVNKTRFNASPLGSWGGVFAGWSAGFATLGAASGCRGPGVSTGFMGAEGVMPATIYPFDACSGVMAQAAATSKLILTVSIVFFSAWRLVRIVGKPFGYDLNVVRESGKV